MELLEQHFDTAFSAPEGIQKLRELILTLAMQGKLVPQNPNDLPASELLKEIDAEKKRLVKAGKIKTPKHLPESIFGEVPYVLPQGWQWVRLGSIGNIFNGNSINASEKESKYAGAEGLPYIATKDVGYGFDPLDYENGICIPLNEAKFRVAHQGAVLICAEGGSAGKKCGLTDRDICFGNKLFANELYGHIPSRFILYTYLSPVFRASFAAAMTGIIGGVSIAKFVEILLPLPPLEEQHRIVARIDQLMACCDALEKLRADQKAKRLAVHAAALSQLLDTTGGGSANDAWAFITQYFGDLYAVKENIAELRKAILQLAVMGKLVPQYSNDAPASELLKEIETEKKRLVKEGKIKILKPLPEIKPEEIPYALPLGWAWARLQDVLDVRDGTHDSPRDAIGPNTYPLITSKNFVNGGVDFANARQISAEDHFEIIKRSRVERLDILFSMIGGNIGNQIIVEEDREFSIKNVALFKYYNKSFTQPYFIKRFMEHLAIDLQQKAAGGAQPFVSLGFLRNLVIGLPPQLEQQRITSKIDQLMGLCDTLEQRIAAATCKKTELLNAVMAEV
ncbi:restriction endonuclease subunit S [Hydrogenophaga sp. BPS33]|uniref:restriction endonuclease subunit S n=1 Tax=Hydrogenophaga sp. BPS33 TaxID=2651974 RepID=UPI001320125D|nr:restriction endonuclease subunit S [Hydrogenophaga sp. BPS33]QHE85012.1 restriction endonuclease [Hydrogenophaga sp. BPS33]